MKSTDDHENDMKLHRPTDCGRMDDMSFKDEVSENQSDSKENRINAILKTMDADEQKELLEVLADPEYQSAAIHKALRKRGYDLSDASVRRYRTKLQEDLA